MIAFEMWAILATGKVSQVTLVRWWVPVEYDHYSLLSNTSKYSLSSHAVCIALSKLWITNFILNLFLGRTAESNPAIDLKMMSEKKMCHVTVEAVQLLIIVCFVCPYFFVSNVDLFSIFYTKQSPNVFYVGQLQLQV